MLCGSAILTGRIRLSYTVFVYHVCPRSRCSFQTCNSEINDNINSEFVVYVFNKNLRCSSEMNRPQVSAVCYSTALQNNLYPSDNEFVLKWQNSNSYFYRIGLNVLFLVIFVSAVIWFRHHATAPAISVHCRVHDFKAMFIADELNQSELPVFILSLYTFLKHACCWLRTFWTHSVIL